MALEASRVSRTRTGTTGTSREASPALPIADAANSPPPPNVMATAAPAAAHRDRHTSSFMTNTILSGPHGGIVPSKWSVVT